MHPRPRAPDLGKADAEGKGRVGRRADALPFVCCRLIKSLLLPYNTLLSPDAACRGFPCFAGGRCAERGVVAWSGAALVGSEVSWQSGW